MRQILNHEAAVMLFPTVVPKASLFLTVKLNFYLRASHKSRHRIIEREGWKPCHVGRITERVGARSTCELIVASLKDKALKAKDSGVSALQGVKDRNTR